MSRITERGATGALEVFNTSTDTSLATLVGTRYDTSDGRELVLVQNGGTAIVAGKLYQGPVAVGANHQNLAVTAFSAASNSSNATVTVTLGGTLATANQYQGGYAIVVTGTGNGQTLRIASHPAGTSSGSVVVNLEDNPAVALDTTSTISLVYLPYGSANGTGVSTNGVVLASHTSLVQPVGVSLYAIPASTSTVAEYGFLVTRGASACLVHGTPAIGLDVGASASVDGAVDAYAVATGARVGTAIITGVDTHYMPISVQL